MIKTFLVAGFVAMLFIIGAKMTISAKMMAQDEEVNTSKGQVEQGLSDGPINTMINNNIVFLGNRPASRTSTV